MIHHTGVVVHDLSRSIRFYERFLGGKLELLLEGLSGADIAHLHGLSQARFDLAFVAFGNTRLELFEFELPADGRRVEARGCDVGAVHIAFEVDDVRGTYRWFESAGVRCAAPPLAVMDREGGEHVLAFCADPDGNRIELIQST